MNLRGMCGAPAWWALTLLAVTRAGWAQEWVAPAGIPAPPFGIAEVAGPFTHYVDNTHPSATDTGNPNGSPALPRRTLPSSLAAGSVVEVHGGPYQFTSDPAWSGTGSASSPIFVRGVGSPLLRAASGWNELRVQGSYWVIEGFVFQRAAMAIADNDSAGTIGLSASVYSVGETGGNATISVTRSGEAAGGVTVDYATSSGSALPGSDYTTSSGTLVFAAGETTKSLAIPILPDALVEGAETLGLSLASPGGGASLGAVSAATLYIVDDD